MNLESEEKPMRRGKYSSEQILAILKEHESGTPIAELCRTHGMHSETLYAWKRKFMGMQGADVQKLRQLTDENARLKKVVANMALEVDALKDALEKNS
jgi:putative transposase